MNGLDTHAGLDSPLHHWDARCKLIGLMGLVFSFSYVQDLRLLPAMLAATAIVYALSRLPLSFLLTRLRAPGFFLIAVAILLPFLSGSTVIVQIGPLAVRQEGALQLLVVVTKFLSILTCGLVLFGTAPFLTMVKAMRALGLPDLLADMTLYSYRYIHEIGHDLGTMETAMNVRGFSPRRPSGRAIGILSSLAGTILVRSYERSERVYKAMVLRGYGQSPHPRQAFRAGRRDLLATVSVLVVATGFVAAELMLRTLGG